MKKKNIDNEVREISKKARHLTFKGDYKSSIEEYKKALTLLGEQVTDSDYSVYIFSGIGEAYFLQDKWKEALEYYGKAVKSKDGVGEPIIHLRLGQLRYMQGDIVKAKDELMRAYMGGGEIMFEGEDSKYFNLICEIINKHE